MKIGLAQIYPKLGDLKENIEMHKEAISRAKEKGVDLLVFPELSLTGYHLLDITYDVARNIEDPEIQAIVHLADGIDIAFGFVENDADYRIFNSALYVADRQIRHIHRKIYFSNYGMFNEARYFGQGDHIRSFSTRFGKIGMLVGEDLWHPSTSYILAQDGAHLLLALVNAPGQEDPESGLENQESWYSIIQNQSKCYGMFTCYVQRVGVEDGLIFSGGSTVADPYGNLTAVAPMFEESLQIIDLDLERVRRARYQMPFLRDEKLDLTARELQRIIEQRTGGARR